MQSRVYIVDDEASDRDYMQSVMQEAGYDVHAFADAHEFLAELGGLSFGCVLLDLRLPGLDGLNVLEQMRAREAQLPTVLVSGRGDIRSAVESIKLGASDFIEKPFTPEALRSAVRLALDSTAADMMVPSRGDDKSIWDRISPREAHVLRMLLQGYKNKQVAFELGIRERTVEAHRANMMRRLKAPSFAHLIRLALRSSENHSA